MSTELGAGVNAEKKAVQVKYMECLKNHAVAIGGNARDGCGEFLAGGEDGTIEALKCSACNCHRNFHRKIHIVYHQNQRQPAYPQLVVKKKKRFRTKFSQEQKDKMQGFAENAGWTMQKLDEAKVRGFCQEVGITRKVLKVWMHNNKYHFVNKNTTTSTSNN